VISLVRPEGRVVSLFTPLCGVGSAVIDSITISDPFPIVTLLCVCKVGRVRRPYARAAGGRSIATLAHPVDRPSHILAVSLPSFRPSAPWAST
jgi:hypothetical protein